MCVRARAHLEVGEVPVHHVRVRGVVDERLEVLILEPALLLLGDDLEAREDRVQLVRLEVVPEEGSATRADRVLFWFVSFCHAAEEVGGRARAVTAQSR